MVARFNVEAAKLNLVAEAQARGITPLQAVTLASIVEKEVNQTADLRKAAAVMYNRLQDTGEFPTLGMDSTIRYALGDYTGPLTQSQLGNPSPYNTRVIPASRRARSATRVRPTLKAVLAPVVGDYTYFVYLPKEKKTVFTASSSEFNQLQQQFCTESPELLSVGGVLGSPIAHSLSPVLHRAAYAHLGLTGLDVRRARVHLGAACRRLLQRGAGRPGVRRLLADDAAEADGAAAAGRAGTARASGSAR